MSGWREQIARNKRRTRWVIATFIGLYLMVGLLVDVFLASNTHQAPLGAVFKALITFQLFPVATFLMAAIAVISLLVTHVLYDRIMLLGTEYSKIDPNNFRNLKEQQLYNVIEEMKIAAGLQFMPRVFIIEANYMNAFASGFSEKSALVAITRGLMEKLARDELQAVMAHELSHIRHLDIKLTLTVTVLSNIMLIVIDVLFYSVLFSRRQSKQQSQLAFIIILLRYTLPLITMLLGLFLSRTREFMADAGCVELMRSNEPLARALIKINEDHNANTTQYQQEYGQTAHEQVRRAAYIYDPVSTKMDPVKSFSNAFSTHPNLRERLKAIGYKS